jgi:two-component system response regulator
MKDQDEILQILLAEDNRVDILMTQEAIANWKIGNQLSIVRNGKEALNFLFKQGKHSSAPLPDLLILDLNLPRKNGREILREIKSNPELSGIFVVIMTTTDEITIFKECIDLGANFVMTKPINYEDYLAAIDSLQHLFQMLR